MLTVYLICLLTGGAMVLISVLFGGDSGSDVHAEAELEAHLDLDASADVDVGHDIELHADADHDITGHSTGDVASDIWLPFLSLRFWTFAAAFFGLTGTLLSLFGALKSHLMNGVISAAMGLIAGTGMAYLLHFLQKREVNSTIPAREYIGRTADVVVSIDGEHPGKIRLNIHNNWIELLAISADENSFARGDTAFVIAVNLKDGTAKVVKRFKELEGSSESTKPREK